jgi:hypothetical protein
MNELRARLRSVEVAVLRLSQRRWEQVMEVIMAIAAHTQPGGECRAATERVRNTSTLSRDAYYRALREAKAWGLVRAATAYTADVRTSDRLRIDLAALDGLVDASRAWRATRCNQLPPGATSCHQVQPAATTLKEPARALVDLPKNLAPAAAFANEAAAAAEFDWESARPVANRLLAAVAPGGLRSCSDETREWIAKVALLAVRFGPEWIEPAFERLKNGPAHSPRGLVTTILDDECQRRGTRLNRELARVRLPAEISHARQ